MQGLENFLAFVMGSVPFLFSLTYFIVGSYLMAVAGDITDQIYFYYYCYGQKHEPFPLPDLFNPLSKPFAGFLHSRNLNPFLVADIFLSTLPILFLLQLFTNGNLHGKRKLILSRLFLIWGTCCYLRAMCLTTTVLPSCESDICSVLGTRQLIYERHSIFWTGLLHLAAPLTQFYSKADYMFSGHAAAATTVAIFCTFDLMDPSWLHRTKTFIIFTFYLAALFAICLTRIHYTADVIIGVIISTFCYLSYHLMVEKSKSKQAIFPLNVIRWVEEQNLHLE